MSGAYDRLSPLDRYFLIYESPSAHMHVAGASIFEAGPLRRRDGGIDIDRIRKYVESRLEKIPRYRQIVRTTPFGTPFWVDDRFFNIEYHVRHTSLPRPGQDSHLKALCGRVFSQPLDRTRPLWEIWVVEGLDAGDQFAFISKTHHAMVDGISSVDLLETLLKPEPIAEFEPAKPFVPRPAPPPLKLALDDVGAVARGPIDLLKLGPALIKDVFKKDSEVRASIRGLADLTLKTIRRPSQTPLNKRIGPHRRFDWHVMDLGAIKAVRKVFGGSVNDVVLATVAGAVRRFLIHRGVDPKGIQFRVMAPVSVRPPEARGSLGNKVAAWMVPLPIGEPDPRRRLLNIQETTSRLKEEKNALGAELLTEMAGWTPSTLLSLAAKIPWRDLPFNMIVTNVPGPQKPVYLLGAKMLADYGLVPIAQHIALGIVLFSYDGKMTWGFNADWDVVPDLEVFVQCVQESFKEMYDLARPQPPETTTQPPAPPA